MSLVPALNKHPSITVCLISSAFRLDYSRSFTLQYGGGQDPEEGVTWWMRVPWHRDITYFWTDREFVLRDRGTSTTFGNTTLYFIFINILKHGPTFNRWYFQTHFLVWDICSLNQISLQFVPCGLVDNKPAWVHLMVYHRRSDKPLYINQSWPKPLTPLNVNKPRHVKLHMAVY